MHTEYVIQTNQLCKRYKGKLVVDHVDLHVKAGDIYGFIGRNGAGKSTTMKMICGLVHPSVGEIVLFGKTKETLVSRKRIGALIEQAGLYANMNAYDNMMMKAKLIGLIETDHIKEVLNIVKLQNAGNKKVKDFSMGMKQRLGIAMALLGNPDVLLLDEPTNGLDPEGIKEIRETLLQLNEEKGMTMIISSHNLGELDKLANTYGIIKDGRLMQEITKQRLQEVCQDYIYLEVDDPAKASVIIEQSVPQKHFKVVDAHGIRIYQAIDTGIMTTALVKAGVQVHACYEHKQDLENYFVDMMEGGSDHE